MLTLSQMTALSQETREALLNARLKALIELEGEKWLLVFEDRKYNFFFALKPPFSRFHLTTLRDEKKISPSSFTESLGKFLLGKKLSSIELLNQDRILQLKFQEFSLIIEFFSKGPNAYLVDDSKNIISSFTHVKKQVYQPPLNRIPSSATPTICTSKEIEEQYRQAENKAVFAIEKLSLQKQILLKIKKCQQLIQTFLNELKLGKKHLETAHDAELLQAYFFKIKKGMAEVEVEDWDTGAIKKISLDPKLEPQEELRRRFHLSRKLKKKMEMASDLLEKERNKEERWQGLLAQVEQISSIEELRNLKKQLLSKEIIVPKEAKIKKKTPFRKFISEKGLLIFAGRNDKENEELTFRFANGLDYWLHAANFAGSHVIIRSKKGHEIDHETLLDALQIALYYSKAKESGEDDIIVTECKFVTKAKGSKSGLANVSKHRLLKTHLDSDRINRLFSRLESALP